MKPIADVSGRRGRPLLSFGPLLLIICVAAGGCGLQKPTVSLGGIKLAGIDSDGVTLDLQMDVNNPNPIGVPLKEMTADLVAGETTLARIADVEQDLAIPAMGSRRVSIPVQVPLSTLAKLGGRPSIGDVVDYELAGSFVFEAIGARLPVNYQKQGRLYRPRLPRWSFKRIEMPSSAGGPARLVVTLTNPNAFSLPVGNLAGTLSLSGEDAIRIGQPSVSSVGPKESAEVEIPIELSLRKLLTASKLLLKERAFDAAFQPKLEIPSPISLIAGPADE